MNLTLRQLRAFSAVASLGGFTAAARQLHLTQSALSALVKDLETALGVRLLDRSTREVALTRAGREFLPLAERVLQDIRDAATHVTDLAHGTRGIVRVAALELTSCALLPPIIAAFRKEAPGLEVRLTDAVLEQMLAKVRSGEVDIGIGPEPAPDPELARMPLLRAPFLLVCARTHPLARRRRVKWADLRGERFITMIRNFRAAVMNEPHGWPRELEIAPAAEVALITTALGMAAAGLGVTACPTYAAPLVRGFDLAMRPLGEPVVTAELHVFTRRGRTLPPGAERFLGFMRRHLARRMPGAVVAGE
ncbi:MAG: LysR substrate-binding domain-containing protein [Burkholderiales bacterium]